MRPSCTHRRPTRSESQALELPIIFTDADEGDTHSVMVTSSDDRVGIEGEGNISGSAYRFVPVAGFWAEHASP